MWTTKGLLLFRIMEQNISIEDNSGDKEFFTIIPNFILNHSTHWDREVYIQMKRIAGESGKCYMSLPKLATRCGMGKERLNKSIKYLIDHKWIKFAGKTPIQTKGGTQFSNTYKIENIWKLNTKFYKGGSPQGYPQDKGGSPEATKGGRQIAKGGSPQGRKEEPSKEDPFKEEKPSSFKRKKKPYYDDQEMRKKDGKWWVIPKDQGSWLEFAGKEEDIIWK